jgi:eukaryotic-like serine/threonine-protein kinase
MPVPPTANKATKLVAGTLVAGRYRVAREIGRGGMAHVYEAKHVDIGKGVAVKVLASEFITSPVVVERFLREARAAAAVRSPYICDVYDSGKLDDGRPFLVMELLEGESLYERMVRVRQFDPKTTVRIITHVSRGLMKAHAGNIVHRDLKPENIFLTTNEDGEMHAKILDFGLAKFYAPSNDGGAAQARLTREGAIFGTPAYMSPEQVQGQGAVDHRADIWALGCIAYECLTGRTVWSTDKGIAMTFAQIASAPIPQLTKYRPDLPRSIEEWFSRALSRDIEVRYQTAKDLAEGFAQSLEQGPPSLMMTGEIASADHLIPTEGAQPGTPPAPQISGTTTKPAPPVPAAGSPAAAPPAPGDLEAAPMPLESLTNETGTSSTVKGTKPPKRSLKPALIAGTGVALIGLIGVGGWQLQRTQTRQGMTQPPPSASASDAPTASSSASAAPAPVPEAAAPGPKWLPLVTEGQAKLLAGEPDEAVKRFKEAQDTMGSAVARAMNDHLSAAAGNKGPCRLAALGRLRPFSLATGNTGRPALVSTTAGIVAFWTDDHESPQRDHTYALVLDPSTLKPLGPPVDVTPEAERVGRFDVAALGEKIALAYTDSRGTSQGLYLRWLGADGRISAPRSALAPARAAGGQPSLSASGKTLWVAWEEKGESDKTDLLVSHATSASPPVAGVRLTDLRKSHIKPRVVAPQIAATATSLELMFRVDRDALRPITYLHVPLSDPLLATGLPPAKPNEKEDRTVGQLRVLAPLRDKGDVPSHKGDSPSLTCSKDGCFAVWHIERSGSRGGWYASQIDPHKGEIMWSKKFLGAGGRPHVGTNAEGVAEVVWFEGGRIRAASLGRDGVGAHSILAHIAGDQPPPAVVGVGPKEWVVSWLDFEGGRLEPYVLRASCRLPSGNTNSSRLPRQTRQRSPPHGPRPHAADPAPPGRPTAAHRVASALALPARDRRRARDVDIRGELPVVPRALAAMGSVPDRAPLRRAVRRGVDGRLGLRPRAAVRHPRAAGEAVPRGGEPRVAPAPEPLV